MRMFIVLAAMLALAGPVHAANAKLHKLVGTAIAANGVVTAVPVGTTVIDTKSIKCGAASGCIIAVDTTLQAISNGSAGPWQICILVDGNQASPGCPVQGTLPTSNYVVGNLRTNAVVVTGTHTVQTEIVMPSAGSYAAWESDYSVYKN
ncbi:MAG TPA: hypothetical protein VG889_06685 [Rhizomicrobium sp.]|nr:hypothetical protein [Rhizomicrobium sp.]